MKRSIGSIALGLALCLPCAGVTYTGGACDASLLTHRWSFNGDYYDSVGGTTASAVGTVALDDRAATTTGGTDGSGYINLGSGLLPSDGSAVTIEIWGAVHSLRQWSRVFDIGVDRNNYLMLAWSYQTDANKDRCEIKKGGSTLLTVDNTLYGYTLGVECHISITIEPRSDGKANLRWMRRDVRTGEIVKQGSATTTAAWSVADLATASFFLGHSLYYPDDHNANASYNEVRIWKTKLTDTQLAWSARLGADTLPTFDINDSDSFWVGGGDTVELDDVVGTITKTGNGTLVVPAASGVSVKVQQGTLAAVPSTVGDAADGNVPSHLVHRWSFNGNFVDSVGGLDATGIGVAFSGNAVRTTGGGKSASYVSLDSTALPKDRPFTLEIFATPRSTHSWSRIFSFGKGAPSSDPKENFFMSWTRTTNVSQDQVRFRYNGGGDAIYADDSLQPFTLNTKWHVALVYVPNVQGDGRGRFRWSKTDLNGGNHREAAALTEVPVDLATWGMDGFYLGRSYWSADLDAAADYDEVRIWDSALPSEQLIANAKQGPDSLPAAESTGAMSSVELAADAVFSTHGGSVSVDALSGSGTVQGAATVLGTLDIAGEAVGAMALEGRLAVKGSWVVDLDEEGMCDRLTGTGALDVAQATVTVRDPSRLRGGSQVLAEVGTVTGAGNARIANVPGARLVCENGRLTLVRDGVYLIVW